MPMGQTEWLSQDSPNKSYIIQAGLSTSVEMEAREGTAWGDFSREKTVAPHGNGMMDANTDATGNGVLWTKTLESGDEFRWTLQRRTKGAASFGDTAVKQGDYIAYLHQNAKMNEVDSEATPIQGRLSQQRVRSIITDPKGDVRKNLTLWHQEQFAYDCLEALINGGSEAVLASRDGGLGLDLGRGAGARVTPEIFYTAQSGLVAGTPRTNGYEDNVATALKAMEGTTKYLTRASIKVIRNLADKHKIKKAQGTGYDYVFVCDPELLQTLTDLTLPSLGTSANMTEIYKSADMGKGAGHKLFDLRGAIVIDGVLLVPDRFMAQYRPDFDGTSGLGVASPTRANLNFGQLGLIDKRGSLLEGSRYPVGLGFLLGDGALLELRNGGVTIAEKVGDYEKGWSAHAWTMRGIQRSWWTPKDGENTAGLQQSAIGFAFNVPTTYAL